MMKKIAGIALSCALALPILSLPASAEMSAEQTKDVEAIIERYLVENPELIERALVALEEKRRAAEKAQQTEAIASLSDTIYNSEHQVVLGNPEGAVTLVEFFDYNCGYCRRAMDDMVALMASNPDLRIVLKEFPILSEGSMEAARVAVAVNMVAPERYLDFHQEMFGRGGMANEAKAMSIVGDLGIDSKKIENAAASPTVDENIAEVRSLAIALGVSGTPSYVIGNEAVSGAVGFDKLQEQIAAARQCDTVAC